MVPKTDDDIFKEVFFEKEITQNSKYDHEKVVKFANFAKQYKKKNGKCKVMEISDMRKLLGFNSSLSTTTPLSIRKWLKEEGVKVVKLKDQQLVRILVNGG